MATFFKRNNPINRITLLPYYTIICQVVCGIIFYSIFLTGTVTEHIDRWYDSLSAMIYILWIAVMLLNTLNYVLVSELILFQTNTPVTEVLIMRDRHFKRERRIIKLYALFMSFVVLTQVLEFLIPIIFILFNIEDYQYALEYKRIAWVFDFF